MQRGGPDEVSVARGRIDGEAWTAIGALDLSLERHQQDWNDLAELDPLWAILQAPAKRHGRWDIQEFLESGKRQIGDTIEHGALLGYPRGHESALDFGCGVGRLTRALDDSFESCVGVDVAPAMIEQARRLNADRPSCSFVLNARDDLEFAADRSFDFVYSDIVLQHIPSRAMVERYVFEFARILRPGGLLVFQLPSYTPLRRRVQWRRRVYAVLRSLGVPSTFLYNRLGLNPTRMNAVSEQTVLSWLATAGMTVVEVQKTAWMGWHDRRYWVTRPDISEPA
jgi:ubiquinone/menaquinone biosynthesis C-methylase UbiE